LSVFETPGSHILPVPYIVVILLPEQKCIISLPFSGAAGCNWPCGCRGSTLIIHDLLTEQLT